MTYLDFHTHQKYGDQEVKAIYSLDLLSPTTIGPLDYFSVGLHPWNISNQTPEDLLLQLEDMAKNPHCLFIGETGIDTLSGEISEQVKWFQKHIVLAKTLKKPLVLHSIRAFHQILSILKKESFSDNIFFHDFNGNADEINRILKAQKNSYFSVGQTLMARNSKISRNIDKIPREKIFLESDDGPTPIQEIYQKSSQLLNIEQEEMKQQVWSNFKNLKLADDFF